MTGAAPPSRDMAGLLAIMARLRDPQTGCPWDVAQDFRTIAPYTIEEAYEVSDAIERNDLTALQDELGDLLFQTVFHARMAEERGAFAFGDVVARLCDKMIRRHPHVFAGAAHSDWEDVKAAERQNDAPGASALEGVALGLPALLRAEKLQKRAARTGFDWPDPEGARAKLIEELDEVDTAENDQDRAEEIGDLLFAAVNWARKLGIDAESALRAANRKFEQRFRAMEEMADGAFAALDLDAQDALWHRAKDLPR